MKDWERYEEIVHIFNLLSKVISKSNEETLQLAIVQNELAKFARMLEK